MKLIKKSLIEFLKGLESGWTIYKAPKKLKFPSNILINFGIIIKPWKNFLVKL